MIIVLMLCLSYLIHSTVIIHPYKTVGSISVFGGTAICEIVSCLSNLEFSSEALISADVHEQEIKFACDNEVHKSDL